MFKWILNYRCYTENHVIVRFTVKYYNPLDVTKSKQFCASQYSIATMCGT